MQPALNKFVGIVSKIGLRHQEGEQQVYFWIGIALRQSLQFRMSELHCSIVAAKSRLAAVERRMIYLSLSFKATQWTKSWETRGGKCTWAGETC